MKKKDKLEDYEGFVEKFKPKKTTDDCYTPPEVYEAVRGYVDRNVLPLGGLQVVRPFFPGGDYKAEEYGPGSIVLDNPPFSILSEIVRWYTERGVRFWLFAPSLAMGHHARAGGVTCVVSHADITYSNGAVVRTGFVTNAWPGAPRLVVAGRLGKALKRAQEAVRPARRKIRIEHPLEVVTCALLEKLATRGIEWTLPREETLFIRKTRNGRGLYGGGYLISERLAAERLAAERLAPERMEREAARARFCYELTEEERAAVRELGKGGRP